MRKLVFTAIALLGLIGVQPAMASSYITIEGTSVTVQDNLDGDLSPMGLRFRMGMPVGENLDIEGHFGFSADDEHTGYDEFGAAYMGVFLKAYLPIGFNSALYGLGGFSAVSLTQKVSGSEFTDERTGFSYGVGLETKISERVDLTADYMRYVRDEGLFEDISAVSFGLKLYF